MKIQAITFLVFAANMALLTTFQLSCKTAIPLLQSRFYGLHTFQVSIQSQIECLVHFPSPIGLQALLEPLLS